MNATHSDALVFFGATGDLAYKKIFPALQAMLKRGHLEVPVIGVAKTGWKLDQPNSRPKEALERPQFHRKNEPRYLGCYQMILPLLLERGEGRGEESKILSTADER